MQSVSRLLKSKSSRPLVFSVPPSALVIHALQLLAVHQIGALIVMAGDQLVGIVSERDYTRKVERLGRTAATTLVREIMTSPVICVGPHHSNERCMAVMTENKLRHLPVMLNNKIVGMISIGDLVKDIIAEQRFTIEQLEHYIQGKR